MTKHGHLLAMTWFPDSDMGGVNQAVLNLVRAMLSHDDWNPYLLVTSRVPIPADHPQLLCQAESIELPSIDLPLDRPLSALRSFLGRLPLTLIRLAKLLRGHNVQCVSSHFPDTDSLHFVLLRQLGWYQGKVFLFFHGEDVQDLKRKKPIGQWAARYMMRHADAVVGCSRGLVEELAEYEPACAKHAKVIYNAIDIPAFLNRIDSAFALPEALHNKTFLLNVARYEHKKGHDILIRAFEKISARFPELMLVTIGTPPPGQSAANRAMFDRSPVRDRILMLENVPHSRVGVFLKAARIFVLSSRREGFPIVLLEAGAAQTAVVAAACLGVPEIIEDHVTGRLAPVEDSEVLADAVIHLLENDPERQRLARNLNQLVVSRFSWESVYRQYLALADGKL